MTTQDRPPPNWLAICLLFGSIAFGLLLIGLEEHHLIPWPIWMR